MLRISEPTTTKPVSPGDCALAVGLPLTREEFMGGLTSGRDFARHVRRTNFRHGLSEDYYWEEVYRPVTETVLRVCNRVEKVGVAVRESVTLEDLAELVRCYKVVSLVGHWRFMALVPEDLLDAYRLIDALRGPEGALHTAISAAMQRRSPELWKQYHPGSPGVLLASLNEMIRDAHLWYHREGGLSVREPTEEDLQRLTRPAVEQAFPTLIRQGLAIELSDGMHKIGEIVDAIPAGFDGLLDLTICNSVILGAAIKRVRPGCTVAVSRYSVEIAVRTALYSLVIEELKHGGLSFMDAVARVHSRRR
jgi:hypothetical protein